MTITISKKITAAQLDEIMQSNDTMLYDDLRKGYEYIVTVGEGLLSGEQFRAGFLPEDEYGEGWAIEDFYAENFAPYKDALDDLLEQINAAIKAAQIED